MMEHSMRMKFKSLATAAIVAATAVAVQTGPAEARLACNYYGDCWHVNGRYHGHDRYGYRRYDRGYYGYYGDDWYRHHRWYGDRRDYRDGYYGRESRFWLGF
jgi:hypothetical protein